MLFCVSKLILLFIVFNFVNSTTKILKLNNYKFSLKLTKEKKNEILKRKLIPQNRSVFSTVSLTITGRVECSIHKGMENGTKIEFHDQNVFGSDLLAIIYVNETSVYSITGTAFEYTGKIVPVLHFYFKCGSSLEHHCTTYIQALEPTNSDIAFMPTYYLNEDDHCYN